MDEVTEYAETDKVGNDAYREYDQRKPVWRVLDELDEFHNCECGGIEPPVSG